MLHEAKDRQKFVSDVQYLRDIQHKVDSEYQAYLRRQDYRQDPNEKKKDQFGGPETSGERTRCSSGSSSKQSSGEDNSLAETRPAAKSSLGKCESSRLPAIDHTLVRQKHKSTMTPRKPEGADPGRSSPAQAPQILYRKRRPNLGRLTVSPELQSPAAARDRGRQKAQLPVKVSALRGAEQTVQQEGLLWAGDMKLKRPMRERRNLVPYSQKLATTESTLKRGKRGDPKLLPHSELHPPLVQSFQGPSNPLGSRLISATTLEGPRNSPFRFRDKDFRSILTSTPGGDGNETEEETHVEEELLLARMCSSHSHSRQKKSRFLGASAALSKTKPFDKNPETRRKSPARSEFSRGQTRVSTAGESKARQPSPGQSPVRDPALPKGDIAKEDDSSVGEHEQNPHTTAHRNLDNNLHAESTSWNTASRGERPGTRGYRGSWHTCLNSFSSSLDYFLLGPTAPRVSLNSTYPTPGSFVPSALSHIMPVDLAPTSADRSGSEVNSRDFMHRPLCPIRHRNLLAGIGNQSYFTANGMQEQDVRRAGDTALASPPREAPLHAEELALDPQGCFSLEPTSSSPARMNLQDHLQVPASLQENVPFTFFAVSDFPDQNDYRNRATASDLGEEKGDPETKGDPEKLKKLQESLLEEDSEEEGDLCRICQIPGGSPANPLLEPCACVGSLQFVHQECLKTWLKVKITSGADLGSVKTCEMCKQGLLINPDDFNMTEFFQKHQQFRVQNQLMNSGLYLVLLLHLYEQRFAALMRLNSNLVNIERLSRSYTQPRPEENENYEVGEESGVQPSNRRVM